MDHTERAPAYLLQLADVIEANAEELVAARVREHRQAVSLTMSDEIVPMVDQIRFFAGAARVLEGKSGGEYMRGFTSYVRASRAARSARSRPGTTP